MSTMPPAKLRDPWYAASVVVAVMFIALFTAKAIYIHDVLGTSAYDLGIIDQNIWLLSQFEPPYTNTVRGLHVHGDHLQGIDALFVPLYLLYPSVFWLFLFQTISVAAGSLLIYRIGQQLGITSGGLLFALGVAYLANPAVHNPLLWQYHSAVMAAGLYFAWILCYLRKNLVLFVLILVLLLNVREDMCFTTATFGLVLLVLRQWRFAAWTIGLSFAWFLIVFFWLLPLFNGEGYFRMEAGAGTLSGIVGKMMDPQHLLSSLGEDKDVIRYWLQLFSPVAFLPVVAPLMVVPAIPSMLVNSLIGAYNINIDYHYNFNAIPFIYYASLVVLARLGRIQRWLPILVVGVIVMLSISGAGDVSKLRHFNLVADWRNWNEHAQVRDMLRQLRQAIGPDAGVAASDWLVPQLSQRKSIYLFPNPWRVHYWGIRGEQPHSPNHVDILVLSRGAVSDHYPLIYYLVEQGYFQKTDQNSYFSVYRRMRPEAENTESARRSADRHYLMNWPYRFTDLRLGPVFETTEKEFSQIHIVPRDGPAEDWRPVDVGKDAVLDVDVGRLRGDANLATAYLYARITVDREVSATLELGSDDGISVWLNGIPLWTNIVPRPATLGDDKVPFQLRAGDNHFYFRLNNITSAWRLKAFVNPVSANDSFGPLNGKLLPGNEQE